MKIRCLSAAYLTLFTIGASAHNIDPPSLPTRAEQLRRSEQVDLRRSVVLHDVMIPMRDGVQLAAEIYLPKGRHTDSGPRYPTILARTPYDKRFGESPRGWTREALNLGYAVVVQDVRGTYASEGEFRPLLDEGWGGHQDGVDTIAWILKQPWSDGRVGTTGMSYVGATQILAAPLQPPGLVASFVEAPAINQFTDMTYVGGAFALATSYAWSLDKAPDAAAHLPELQASQIREDVKSVGADSTPDVLFEALKHRSLQEAAGVQYLPFWQDWLANSDNPAFFDSNQTQGRLQSVTAPLFLWGGWYDIFLRNTYNVYKEISVGARDPRARTNVRLLIGPWAHILCTECPVFPRARVDDTTFFGAWMNRWFRGLPNKVFDYPVILYVMGANRWRAEEAWPVPGSVLTPYYLHSRGGANSVRGDGRLSTVKPTSEPWDHYDYDPHQPVPSLHGRSLFGGRAPQNSVEGRDDVLVFSTERLPGDVEVTGEIHATLYAASSATDTDWHIKLVDVYPDGTAYNLTSGVVRGRYRQSRTQPSPLKPNSIEPYEIDLWGTSNVFKKGHKIRIEIASSDYPNFDRNPNVYGDLFRISEKDFQVANQRIFHDDAHPSRIDLPLVPANRPRRWIPTPFPAHDATRGYVSVEEDWDQRPPTTPAGH